MNLNSKSNIRVLHILSGDLWGGAEAQVLMLCSSATLKEDYNDKKSTSFDNQALLFNSGKVESRFKEHGIPTLIADEGAGLLRLLLECIKLVKQSQRDHGKISAITAHGYKESIIALLLSLYLRVPWHLQVHGATENYTGIKKIKSDFYIGAQFLLARLFARRIIFVSAALKRNFGFEYNDKAIVIHNAATLQHTEKDRKNENIKTDTVHFIWIGRMTRVKRPDVVLRGFSLLCEKYPELAPQTHLILAGDGPLLKDMKELAEKLSIRNITFSGYVLDTASLYQEQPVLTLTSDSEGMPTVILEACHAKCPIITRKIGGVPEIFEKLPGYPVLYLPTDSPGELAWAMFETFTRIKELRELANQVNTEYFLPPRLKDEHLKLYALGAGTSR